MTFYLSRRGVGGGERGERLQVAWARSGVKDACISGKGLRARRGVKDDI